jgi:hypothetical protein
MTILRELLSTAIKWKIGCDGQLEDVQTDKLNTGIIASSTDGPIQFNSDIDLNGKFITGNNATLNGLASISATTFNGDVTGNVTGTVSSLSNLTTNDLSEGGDNKYFSNTLARDAVSVIENVGDGSLEYDSIRGIITYTGPSALETRAHFSGSTSVTVSDGVVSIGQPVETISEVTFAKVTSADIVGDVTGNVTGDVTGDVTGNVTGTVSSLSNLTTNDLSEGDDNKYFSNTLARDAVSVTYNGGDGSLVYNKGTGAFTYTGPSALETRAHFSGSTSVTVSDGAVSIGQPVEPTSEVTFAKVTVANSPQGPNDLANKSYVDNLIQGLDVKPSVKAATVSNIDLASILPTTIDGVGLSNGDRILLKDQDDRAENGIFVVNIDEMSGITLTRTGDMDDSSEIKGAFVFVEGGSLNKNAGFVSTATGGADGTIAGSIAPHLISFTQFSGAGMIDAGNGLSKNGNNLSVNSTLEHVTKVGTLTGLTLGGQLDLDNNSIVNATNVTATNVTATNVSADDVTTKELKIANNSNHSVTLMPSSSATGHYDLILPDTDGGSGEVLTTNGAGELSWGSGGGGVVKQMISKTSFGDGLKLPDVFTTTTDVISPAAYQIDITPVSDTSKILIMFKVGFRCSVEAGQRITFTITRKTTGVEESVTVVTDSAQGTGNAGGPFNGIYTSNFVDEPSTKSKVTYALGFQLESDNDVVELGYESGIVGGDSCSNCLVLHESEGSGKSSSIISLSTDAKGAYYNDGTLHLGSGFTASSASNVSGLALHLGGNYRLPATTGGLGLGDVTKNGGILSIDGGNVSYGTKYFETTDNTTITDISLTNLLNNSQTNILIKNISNRGLIINKSLNGVVTNYTSPITVPTLGLLLVSIQKIGDGNAIFRAELLA